MAMPFVIFIFWLGIKPISLDSGKASIQLMQAELAEQKSESSTALISRLQHGGWKMNIN